MQTCNHIGVPLCGRPGRDETECRYAITVTDADAVWFTEPVWAWFLRASGEPGR